LGGTHVFKESGEICGDGGGEKGEVSKDEKLCAEIESTKA